MEREEGRRSTGISVRPWKGGWEGREKEEGPSKRNQKGPGRSEGRGNRRRRRTE
jgi:hypothetical protein